LLGSQVGLAEWKRYDERTSVVQYALDPYGTAVQLNEFLYQGEANSGSLERSTSRAFDAMETFKKVGQFLFRDARTSVDNA
jgi:hypothetical protein